MSKLEAPSVAVLHGRLRESIALCEQMLDDEAIAAGVDGVVQAMVASIREGGKVLLCGNGGSAAEAEHLAAELIGRFCLERGPFPAVAVASNVSALTAIANDYSYEDAFARSVVGLGDEGDVVLGLSTSGSSANVVAALEAARRHGMVTVAFVGQPGSPMEAIADHCLRAPGARTSGIQEGHLLLGHVVFELVERELCQS
jgi:D-sedoheptulose 7-phosphate isomerase